MQLFKRIELNGNLIELFHSEGIFAVTGTIDNVEIDTAFGNYGQAELYFEQLQERLLSCC